MSPAPQWGTVTMAGRTSQYPHSLHKLPAGPWKKGGSQEHLELPTLSGGPGWEGWEGPYEEAGGPLVPRVPCERHSGQVIANRVLQPCPLRDRHILWGNHLLGCKGTTGLCLSASTDFVLDKRGWHLMATEVALLLLGMPCASMGLSGHPGSW